jgi:hypothetical protein
LLTRFIWSKAGRLAQTAGPDDGLVEGPGQSHQGRRTAQTSGGFVGGRSGGGGGGGRGGGAVLCGCADRHQQQQFPHLNNEMEGCLTRLHPNLFFSNYLNDNSYIRAHASGNIKKVKTIFDI